MAIQEMKQQPDLIMVTGMSGAGKTTALNTLTDAGYYCVDNLPPTLALATVRECRQGGIRRVALGMDVRVGAFLGAISSAIQQLREMEEDAAVVFLDASSAKLLRRFSETRRPHPMMRADGDGDGPQSMAAAIEEERNQMSNIRQSATLVFDTSEMSVHNLRKQLLLRLTGSGAARPMTIQVLSFGFKHGVPLEANVVFDVRFLQNPYFIEHLRPLSGRDVAVSDYVLARPGAGELLDRLEGLLAFSMPHYIKEGKSYLTVAIGCTGGRHRSVALSIALAQRLRKHVNEPINVVHRDVHLGSSHRASPSATPVSDANLASTAPKSAIADSERGKR